MNYYTDRIRRLVNSSARKQVNSVSRTPVEMTIFGGTTDDLSTRTCTKIFLPVMWTVVSSVNNTVSGSVVETLENLKR